MQDVQSILAKQMIMPIEKLNVKFSKGIKASNIHLTV